MYIHVSADLLVLLVRPIFPDVRVAEVPHFVQHRLHECRSELSGVVGSLLPLVVNDVLARAGVVVETRQCVKKHATTLHVPRLRYTVVNQIQRMILNARN